MPTQTQTAGSDLHAFLQHRRAAGDRVYAVVDAARDGELAISAREEFGLDSRWLFQGTAPEEPGPEASKRVQTVQSILKADSQARMATVAPYLVSVPVKRRYPYPESGFLDRWAERLGSSAGILLMTPVEPEPLVRHLRTIFYATDEGNRRYYFRFYDPRVLRMFLPTCTAAETQEFFGPVRRFLVESEEDGRMTSYQPGGSGVEVTEDGLGASAQSG